MDGSGTRHIRAQSAMEYLMTYGWAILVIAVVLGALFSLGVFNGTVLIGNDCIPSSAFLCKNIMYSSATANIFLDLGQTTGTTWATANFVFVPQGTKAVGGIPSIAFNAPPANTMYGTPGNNLGLVSGQTIPLTLPTGLVGPIALGTPAVGTIWAQYTVSGSPIQQYFAIARVDIRST